MHILRIEHQIKDFDSWKAASTAILSVGGSRVYAVTESFGLLTIPIM